MTRQLAGRCIGDSRDPGTAPRELRLEEAIKVPKATAIAFWSDEDARIVNAHDLFGFEQRRHIAEIEQAIMREPGQFELLPGMAGEPSGSSTIQVLPTSSRWTSSGPEPSPLPAPPRGDRPGRDWRLERRP